ncbi:protein Gemin2 [Bactrocera neohumeralis]|uniref:protein Gemin2 n=1 Tax=Bactrocera tryoni TaxID=59916 RepID=UPI001A9939A2|nr:protein Gemin2 [Bactrocera tryoni]XP_050335023.1 protein Gemin2 [Bactrocera neohumeralis]
MSTKKDILYEVDRNQKRKSNIYNADKETTEDATVNGGCPMETFQQQALEIREPGLDFDPSVAPKDGDEYLMHMLYERKKCPAVMVREPNKCKKNRTAAALAENFKDEDEPLKSIAYNGILPTKEWKDYQIKDFEATREKIVLLRLELHRQRYDQTLEPPLIADPVAWHQFCHDNPPYLKTILRFSQRTLEQLLEFICDWLRAGEEKVVLENISSEDDIMPSTSSAGCNENMKPVILDLTDTNAWLGTWLYGALTCLHIPIEPEVHSTLRDIARVCIRLRGRLPATATGKAVPYNLFILLIAKAFGQMDFAEFV